MRHLIRIVTGGERRALLRAQNEKLDALLCANALTMEVLQTLITGEDKMTKEVDDMNNAIGGLTTAVANNGAAIAQLAQTLISNKDDPAAVEAGAQKIIALTSQLNTGTQSAIDAAAALTTATPTSTVAAPAPPTPDADAALATVQA